MLLRKSNDGRCYQQRRRSATGLPATGGTYSSPAGVRVWLGRGLFSAGIPHKHSLKKLSRPVYMCVLRHRPSKVAELIILVIKLQAQGITLATLLGGAALTQLQSADAVKEQAGDHSWARMVR